MARGATRPSAPSPSRTRRPTLSQLESRGASARRLATAGVRSLLSRTSTWSLTPASGTPSPSAPSAPSRPRSASRAPSAFKTKADAGLEDAAVRAAATIDHEREGAERRQRSAHFGEHSIEDDQPHVFNPALSICEPTVLAASDLFQPLAQAARVVGVIASQAIVAMQQAAQMSTWAQRDRAKNEVNRAVTTSSRRPSPTTSASLGFVSSRSACSIWPSRTASGG
jgi:hypothetical protein